MKLLSYLLASIALPIVFGEDLKTNPKECIKNFSEDTDYFPSKIKVDTATLFSVEYKKSYKLLTNKSTNETIVLYQCGSTKPTVEKVNKYFSVPLGNVTVMDTSALAFIEALGVRGSVKAVDTSGSISSACVQKEIEGKSISALTGVNTTLDKDLADGNQVKFTSFAPKDSASDNKLIAVSVATDPGILERTEWLEYFSMFYNLEEEAQKMTSAINDNFNCLKKKAEGLKKGDGFNVAWVSFMDGKSPSWTISDAKYKKNLMEAAGAKLITISNSTVTNPEEAAKALANADVIVDESFGISSYEEFLKAFNLTPDSKINAIKNKKVLRTDGLGSSTQGYDWYEGAVVMGDAVLQDFIRAIYPENSISNIPKEHLWFRNIAANESKIIVSQADCTKDTEAWKNKAANCSASGTPSKDKGTSDATRSGPFFGLALVISLALLI